MISIQTGPEAITDAELEQLLRRVYVDGGFTDAAVAEQALTASAVRPRGELFVARAAYRIVAGVVIVALPGSPARRIAEPDEAEMHLLAVLSEYRGQGIGSKLIEAVVAKARAHGLARVVLWTQPTMQAAQRLYTAHGFVRRAERDAALSPPKGRMLWVYELALQ